jgi:hypothetical protein
MVLENYDILLRVPNERRNFEPLVNKKKKKICITNTSFEVLKLYTITSGVGIL